MNQEDIRASFIRQRRNLLAICVVNLFVSLAGINLSEINILGNKFTIQNPHIVSISLWIAFGYWLLRYLQLLHDSGNLKIRDSFADILYWESSNEIRSLFEAYAKAELASRNERNCGELQLTTLAWRKKPSLLLPFAPRIFQCGARYYAEGARAPSVPKDIAKDWVLKPKYRFFLSSWCKGIWHVLVRTSLGTEYVLPPAFAFFVAATCVINHFVRF